MSQENRPLDSYGDFDGAMYREAYGIDEMGIDQVIFVGFPALRGDVDSIGMKSFADNGKYYKAAQDFNFSVPSALEEIDYEGMYDLDGTGKYNDKIAEMLCNGDIRDIYGNKVFGDNAGLDQCKAMVDIDEDGLLNYQEIGIVIVEDESKNSNEDGIVYIKLEAFYYSDPAEKDTDGDGINDDVDADPLYKFSILDIIEKYQKLEKMTYDICKEKYGHILSNYELNLYTINMIRTSKYNGFQWNMTSGQLFYDLKSDIKNEDKNIFSYFNGKYSYVQDLSGQKIDFIHMLATMSAYYYETPLFNDNMINDCAGWAGDLQSFIYNLKIGTNGSNDIEVLKEYASKYIFTEDTYFSITDLNSDVDAFNIYELYDEDILMSDKLTYYYFGSDNKRRFNTFVYKQGGISSIENRANDYTYVNSSSRAPIKNLKLNEYAKKAHDENKSVKEYVSKQESQALVYAFIEGLKVRM